MRDRSAVEGGCTAPQFVENAQRMLRKRRHGTHRQVINEGARSRDSQADGEHDKSTRRAVRKRIWSMWRCILCACKWTRWRSHEVQHQTNGAMTPMQRVTKECVRRRKVPVRPRAESERFRRVRRRKWIVPARCDRTRLVVPCHCISQQTVKTNGEHDENDEAEGTWRMSREPMCMKIDNKMHHNMDGR